jgi:aspartate kinase
MRIKVFKFGGASVSTTERIINLAAILKNYAGEKLLIVISAMGKTTNALEKVVDAFFNTEKEEALQLFLTIKNEHLAMFFKLTDQTASTSTNPLNDFFTEVEWLLHDKPVSNYDYYYDQIVPVGELLSTNIVSHYLNKVGIKNKWIDVRDIIRTDNNFRDATIHWDFTKRKVQELIQPLFLEADIILTQGFIGATDENQNTTLGREGSDYTAAVFANLLDAESQTIWKDVQGVMNADPKLYGKAQWIKELSYKEVIEMAYYGAQVIHPKTIKPLQNKNIPLYVKSFLSPVAEGTIIHNKSTAQLPPIIVYKEAQVLVQLSSRDFSFVGEGLTAKVYEIIEGLKFKPNLTQSAAISLLIVIDDYGDKVEAFALQAAAFFDVQLIKDLTLLTIRHYNEEIFNELTANCKIILKQQTLETVQVLLKLEN